MVSLATLWGNSGAVSSGVVHVKRWPSMFQTPSSGEKFVLRAFRDNAFVVEIWAFGGSGCGLETRSQFLGNLERTNCQNF
jgi:hypothetical protein